VGYGQNDCGKVSTDADDKTPALNIRNNAHVGIGKGDEEYRPGIGGRRHAQRNRMIEGRRSDQHQVGTVSVKDLPSPNRQALRFHAGPFDDCIVIYTDSGAAVPEPVKQAFMQISADIRVIGAFAQVMQLIGVIYHVK